MDFALFDTKSMKRIVDLQCCVIYELYARDDGVNRYVGSTKCFGPRMTVHRRYASGKAGGRTAYAEWMLRTGKNVRVRVLCTLPRQHTLGERLRREQHYIDKLKATLNTMKAACGRGYVVREGRLVNVAC